MRAVVLKAGAFASAGAAGGWVSFTPGRAAAVGFGIVMLLACVGTARWGLRWVPVFALGFIIVALPADGSHQPLPGASGVDAMSPSSSIMFALPFALLLMLASWVFVRLLRKSRRDRSLEASPTRH
jgi:hypothetical protein